MFPWFGSSPLTYHHHWAITETPLRYPTPSHRDPTAIFMQYHFLHTIQQVVDEADARLEQSKAQHVGLGDS